MKNDGESGKSLDALLENVETERRGNKDAVGISGALLSGELVSAVAGSDSDRKGVTSGSVYELFNLFGSGVSFLTCLNLNLILDTCKSSELSLNYYAVIVSILNYLLGKSDVVLEGLGRSVDHNGSESAVDTGLAELESITVIKVKSDGNLRILLNCCLYHLYKIGVVCVSTRTLGNLKDNRALKLSCSFGDTLNDLHVVDVESTYSVSAVVSFLKHLFGCYQCHNEKPP